MPARAGPAPPGKGQADITRTLRGITHRTSSNIRREKRIFFQTLLYFKTPLFYTYYISILQMSVSKFRLLCYSYVASDVFGISRLTEVSINLCSAMHI